ncbi:MAG TPA: hypothetical protein VND65_15225 [Candidatus Binatia bacterium]|nr:hypothetical protein [Candidatus Binatia bacterium]
MKEVANSRIDDGTDERGGAVTDVTDWLWKASAQPGLGPGGQGVGGVSSDGVPKGHGHDVVSLAFVTPTHGWARSALNVLFVTNDGGKTWKDIGPSGSSSPRSAG